MKSRIIHQFKLSATILMLLALTWFTVGASFINLKNSKQVSKINSSQNSPADDADQKSCPFDTEESENRCAKFADEFLGEDVEVVLSVDNPLKHYKNHQANAFVLFHGESFSPPPELVS
jgi:hypothetical protein